MARHDEISFSSSCYHIRYQMMMMIMMIKTYRLLTCSWYQYWECHSVHLIVSVRHTHTVTSITTVIIIIIITIIITTTIRLLL